MVSTPHPSRLSHALATIQSVMTSTTPTHHQLTGFSVATGTASQHPFTEAEVIGFVQLSRDLQVPHFDLSPSASPVRKKSRRHSNGRIGCGSATGGSSRRMGKRAATEAVTRRTCLLWNRRAVHRDAEKGSVRPDEGCYRNTTQLSTPSSSPPPTLKPRETPYTCDTIVDPSTGATSTSITDAAPYPAVRLCYLRGSSRSAHIGYKHNRGTTLSTTPSPTGRGHQQPPSYRSS